MVVRLVRLGFLSWRLEWASPPGLPGPSPPRPPSSSQLRPQTSQEEPPSFLFIHHQYTYPSAIMFEAKLNQAGLLKSVLDGESFPPPLTQRTHSFLPVFSY
jgi:hypothetical protein